MLGGNYLIYYKAKAPLTAMKFVTVVPTIVRPIADLSVQTETLSVMALVNVASVVAVHLVASVHAERNVSRAPIGQWNAKGLILAQPLVLGAFHRERII